ERLYILLQLKVHTEEELVNANDEQLRQWVEILNNETLKNKYQYTQDELDSTELNEKDFNEEEMKNILRDEDEQVLWLKVRKNDLLETDDDNKKGEENEQEDEEDEVEIEDDKGNKLKI